MSSENFKTINGFKHIKYQFNELKESESIERSLLYFNHIKTRRSIRDFSEKEVPFEIIENIINSASSAPSGANKQPWTFCVVKSADIKKKIREAAEEEERKSYAERMSEEWLDDLKEIGTDANKPFLEMAPYLIIVFKRPYEIDENGEKHQNYYVNECVGLACGFLISAIHNAGLATLTHTPSPMRFLEKILKRPSNERAFLLLPIGYPSENAHVPDIQRKPLEKVLKLY